MGVKVNYKGAQIASMDASGAKTLKTNGTYCEGDITVQYEKPTASEVVSGTKTITANGEHDVKEFAMADVKIEGIVGKIWTITLDTDFVTNNSEFTLIPANSYIKSIMNDPDAFVFVKYIGIKASTAMMSWWYSTNKAFCYGGTSAYKCAVGRTSTSTTTFVGNVNGINAGDGVLNYSAQLNFKSNGRATVYASNLSSYPIRAGEYQVIAGINRML